MLDNANNPNWLPPTRSFLVVSLHRAQMRPLTKSIAVLASVALHLLMLWLTLHHRPEPELRLVGAADSVTTLFLMPNVPNVSNPAQSPAILRPEKKPLLPTIASAKERQRKSSQLRPLKRSQVPAQERLSAPPVSSPVPAVGTTTVLNKTLPPDSSAEVTRPAPEEDFSVRLAARQRERANAEKQEREEQAARGTPEQQANERGKQIALANIASQLRAAGLEKDDAGGLFQLQHVGPHHAEFLFRGWKKEARRNWSQQLDVEQGSESDIRIAVVKKMIDIIRAHTQGDFTWSSPRLGKQVHLSARPEDYVGLQQFLLREFFPDFSAPTR